MSAPALTQAAVVVPEVTLRIGAERRATGAATAEHINPATGRVDAIIPLAGAAEVDEAVEAALAGQAAWQALRGPERAAILHRLADLIEAHAEDFALRGALDNGTPIDMGGAAVAAAGEWTRFYAGWADKVPLGRVAQHGNSGGEFGYTLRQPYGIIGVIITWNAPLMSLAMKIPPALAAGNAVIVKPSALTPFCAMLFADLAERAGVPAGVINVLPGDREAGNRLVRHPKIGKITFTGGPTTAGIIAAGCLESFKPYTLELGGKSANIVFEDADLDAAAQFAAFMSVGLQTGQGCAFPTRMLVQRSVYEEVSAKVAAIASSFVVGDPLSHGVLSGPVINAAAVERISGMIQRASEEGATLLTGGTRLGGELADGYFFAPTVFGDVAPESELFTQEVFGPVLSITPFEDEAEAIALSNSTDYGLSGYLWTADAGRITRVTEAMRTGGVMVNGAQPAGVALPFGGIGLSGVGREGGIEGLEEFLWTKSVAVAVGAAE
ncbi:MAG: aldehyde dehydrogenase family protein [Arthrobacter sp.]|jgi:aldehyde dehydrogenase (NAD+)|nr:aldehyde dehydrogenase family protein [Arthrobacter sp.]